MKKRIGSINAQPKAKLQVLPFPLTCVFSFVSFFTHDVKKTTFLVGFCLPDSFDLSLLLIGRKKKNRREKLQLRIYAHAVTTTYVTTRMPRPIFVFFFFSQPFGILPLNALRRKRIREKKKQHSLADLKNGERTRGSRCSFVNATCSPLRVQCYREFNEEKTKKSSVPTRNCLSRKTQCGAVTTKPAHLRRKHGYKHALREECEDRSLSCFFFSPLRKRAKSQEP